MPRRPLVALLGALSFLAVGCSSSGGTSSTGTTATSIAVTSTSTASAPSSTDASPATGQGVPVMRYFIRAGVVAAGERHIVSNTDPKLDVVKSLANPLTDTEKAAGLINGVPEKEAFVKSLKVENGVATIDVTRPFETRETQLQVAQVIYTLTQFPDVQKVKFLVEGQDNGATGVPPVGRDGVGKYTPDLLLDSPWPNMQAPASFKVSGDLDPKYSSFDYKVETSFGQELTKGTITAKFGTGRKKFDQLVELPAGTTGGVNLVVTPPAGSKQPPFKVPFTIT